MSYLIAVTGKGGVGKTTVSSLLVHRLVKAGATPVLAIDADPNSCLDAALGVKAEKTVGRAREEVRLDVQAGLAIGQSKQERLRLKIAESLVESEGFDLIAMGRPEGAGCYCYANNVLKAVIAEISGQYPYVVIDNEAGLENVSRRIVQKVDLLVLVSDPSNAGLETLVRLHALTLEMGVKFDRLLLVINRIRDGRMPDRVESIRAATRADWVIGLPDDAGIASFAETGRKVLEIPEDNPVVVQIDGLVQNLRKKQ